MAYITLIVLAKSAFRFLNLNNASFLQILNIFIFRISLDDYICINSWLFYIFSANGEGGQHLCCVWHKASADHREYEMKAYTNNGQFYHHMIGMVTLRIYHMWSCPVLWYLHIFSPKLFEYGIFGYYPSYPT